VDFTALDVFIAIMKRDVARTSAAAPMAPVVCISPGISPLLVELPKADFAD